MLLRRMNAVRGDTVRTIMVAIKLILAFVLVAIVAGSEIFLSQGAAIAQEDARSAKFIIQSCQNFLAGDASQLPFLQGRCFGVIDGLAYGSNAQGRSEVFVRSLIADETWLISVGGGSLPRWRRDGKALFYTSGGRIVEATLSMGARFTVSSRNPVFPGNNMSTSDVFPDGQRLITATRLDQPPRLVIVVNWLGLLKREPSGPR